MSILLKWKNSYPYTIRLSPSPSLRIGLFFPLSPSPFHLFPEFSLYFTCSFSPSRMGFSLFQLFSLQMQWLSPERCQRRPMFPASTFIVRFSFHSSIFSSLLGVLYLVQTISQILVVWVWIELVKKWVKGIWDFFWNQCINGLDNWKKINNCLGFGTMKRKTNVS